MVVRSRRSRSLARVPSTQEPQGDKAKRRQRPSIRQSRARRRRSFLRRRLRPSSVTHDDCAVPGNNTTLLPLPTPKQGPENATHTLALAPALEVALMVVLAHLVNELLLATMLSLIIVSRV